jgi:hypothetical protein
MTDDEVRTKRRTVGERTISLANAEIDARLAQAIRDRAKAIAMVSKLVHWQDRLSRLEQEINSLIGFQQRLSGSPMQLTDATRTLLPPASVSPGAVFSHLNPIPEGVTSIPTKVANPKPSGGNVAAEFMNDKGFS